MESNSEQFGLRIRRKRTVLVYAAVCLLVLGIGAIVAVQWLTHPTEALMPTVSSSQVKVDQANYRLYQSSDSATPGAPLATDNTVTTLPQAGASFRMRVGVENKDEPVVLASQFSSGYYHVCAFASDSKLYCWGRNHKGQLGNGSTVDSSKPVAVNTTGVLAGKTIKQISSGAYHTCVIASDDKVYCWGENSDGRLGNNSTANSSVPVAVNMSGVLAGKTIKQISSGHYHTCALASDDKVYCWGNNDDGGLGNGSTSTSLVPVAVNTTGVLAGKTIKYLSAGPAYHTCVIASDDKVYCWGKNKNGELGNGSIIDSNVPVAVNMSGVLAGKTIKQMSVGSYNTCVIASDDKVYCWGSNGYGQLGNNSTTDSSIPVAVNTTGVLAGKTIKQILSGHYRTCAITSDDKMHCWGNSMGGALGNGSTADSHIPVSVNMTGVLAGKVVRRISIGAFHTCVDATDNKIYCWGSNNYGQLGNNSTTNSSIPTTTYVFKKEDIPANAMKLRVQYAKKTAATCQVVAAGWQDVTNSSALAYSAAGPNNGTAITAAANDPNLPSTSVGYSHQSIVRPGSAAQLTFTNNRDVNAGETGLWDLALTDNGLERNTNYCVRLAADTTAAPGTNIDTYSYYPEFKTADGSLDIRFADAADATLTNPTTVFSAAMTSKTASTTTAKLSNNSSQQLEVANSLSTTGWSVSLAATGGSTAKWMQTGGTASYDFNNSNANRGQLSVDLSSSAFTASGSTPLGQACTTAGVSYGAGGAFVAGTASANAITLATASSSSGLTCLFKLQDISLKQTIPAYQKPGTYTLPVTVTVVAQ